MKIYKGVSYMNWDKWTFQQQVMLESPGEEHGKEQFLCNQK
jgi:Fe-S cluster biosynthesis and repair protein YggX